MNKFLNLTQSDIENTISDIEKFICVELKKETINLELIAKYCIQRDELIVEKYKPSTLNEVSQAIHKLTEENKHLDDYLSERRFGEEAKSVLKHITEKDLSVLVEIYHKKAKAEPPDDKVKATKAIKRK